VSIKDKREKKWAVEIKKKRKEKQVGKNRPAFILIKNLQFKTRERKENNSPKTTYIRPCVLG